MCQSAYSSPWWCQNTLALLGFNSPWPYRNVWTAVVTTSSCLGSPSIDGGGGGLAPYSCTTKGGWRRLLGVALGLGWLLGVGCTGELNDTTCYQPVKDVVSQRVGEICTLLMFEAKSSLGGLGDTSGLCCCGAWKGWLSLAGRVLALKEASMFGCWDIDISLLYKL